MSNIATRKGVAMFEKLVSNFRDTMFEWDMSEPETYSKSNKLTRILTYIKWSITWYFIKLKCKLNVHDWEGSAAICNPENGMESQHCYCKHCYKVK